jgi:hypothetical protein
MPRILQIFAKIAIGIAVVIAVTAGSAQAEPQEISCAREIGAKRAKILVRRCIEVSPATHPPCNAQNPCALIKGEIERGCRFGKPEEPFCKEYAPRP